LVITDELLFVGSKVKLPSDNNFIILVLLLEMIAHD
jgi:hypothetical protein